MLQERDIDFEDSVRVEEQWDKVEKAMTEVAATVYGVIKGNFFFVVPNCSKQGEIFFGVVFGQCD